MRSRPIPRRLAIRSSLVEPVEVLALAGLQDFGVGHAPEPLKLDDRECLALGVG